VEVGLAVGLADADQLVRRPRDGVRLARARAVLDQVGNDKGGYLYQVRAFGRGANLHALWYGELIRRRPGGVSQLQQDAMVMTPASSSTMDPARVGEPVVHDPQ